VRIAISGVLVFRDLEQWGEECVGASRVGDVIVRASPGHGCWNDSDDSYGKGKGTQDEGVGAFHWLLLIVAKTSNGC
jgi:hypothetical protein